MSAARPYRRLAEGRDVDSVSPGMRLALICHEEDPINREGVARWLASIGDLVGIVSIEEPRSRMWKRVRAELRRSGISGFLDVMAFRIYRRLLLARRDRAFERSCLDDLQRRFPSYPAETPVLKTPAANSKAVKQFLAGLEPDLVIARCKVLLRPSVFNIAKRGTLVMHPGICPEYRNAHGCFWALVNRDLDKVGMTLLRIDEGIDTGPVFGYFRCPIDEGRETHHMIQTRTVVENLEGIAALLAAIVAGTAEPIDVRGRASKVWGQPRLSSYFKWKRSARK